MENPFLIYLVKVSISLAFFYAVYMLCMRRDTFFQLRRVYFLLTIAFSALYPLWNIPLAVDEARAIPSYWISSIEVVAGTAPAVVENPINIEFLFTIFLRFIFLVLIARFFVQLASIIRLRYKNKADVLDQYLIIQLTDSTSSSFSFFNWIFINTAQGKEATKEIIVHEQVHARQYHSIDILLAEVLCVCFWWNPIVWLLRREMKINLEYLADEGVLGEGFDTQAYQYTLVHISNSGSNSTLVSNFNVSQLKKRITMMNKKKNSISVAAKYLLAVPLGCILLFGNAERVSASLIESTSPTHEFTLPQEPVVKKAKKKSKTGVVVTNDGEKKNIEIVLGKDAAGNRDTTIVVTGVKVRKGKKGKKSEKTETHLYSRGLENALIIVDGKIVGGIDDLDPNMIESFTILKGKAMEELYGDAAKGKDGVVVVTSKTNKEKK